MLRFDFQDWQLRMRRDAQVQQYDNLTVPIVFYGEFPEEFTLWDMTITVNDNLDVITLEPMDGGMGAMLTAQTLSVQGYYSVQITGRDGVRVRHSSVAQFYNPRSLSGDEQWPEIPTSFTEAVTRAEAAAQSAAASEEAAEEAKQQWENMTAEAETLPAGSPATASYAAGVLHLGIPSGGGGGTDDHRQLSHRDAEGQHPIGAITGLQQALDGKVSKEFGTAKAGQFLIVGDDGFITTIERAFGFIDYNGYGITVY